MRLLILGLTLAVSAGMYSWDAAPTWADEESIQVVELGAESRFPNGIRFFVTVTGPTEIDEIRIFLKNTGKVSAGAYQALQFEAGNHVSAESVLQTGGGGGYIPPGAELTYFFEIRDEAGSVLRTPDQRVVYTDDRFDWQTISSGPITVYYYGDGAEERARMALEAAGEAVDQMAPLLGLDPSEAIRIVSYSNATDMIGALPLRFQVLQGHLEAEGLAFADERVVLIRGFDPDVKGITSHEITHLAVAEVTGRAHVRVPSWLDEGLSEYGNVEPIHEYEEALRRGISEGRVQPLWTLDAFLGRGDEILTAYGQGSSVVRYLISSYGEAQVAELMQAVRSTLNIDQALQRVYGFDQYGLDTEWRLSMGLEPLPRPPERQFSLLPSPTPNPTPDPTKPSPTLPPTATPIQPTPTSNPTPVPVKVSPTPQSTVAGPTPSGEPTAAVALDEEEDGGSTPGCSSPHFGQSKVFHGDPALIAILFGPLAMLALRGRRSQ